MKQQRGAAKTARNAIAMAPATSPCRLEWIRLGLSHSEKFGEVKRILREQKLHAVCEEAACPNISGCFGKGTAPFMILGDLCTRRCPFCDVAHGRPRPPDARDPAHLKLKYVVVTSVDRDGLCDAGATHFVDCIRTIREHSPATKIKILLPDFHGRPDLAPDVVEAQPSDVMKHTLEAVPRLYRDVRPGADYTHSLRLLGEFKRCVPGVPPKSELMVGWAKTMMKFCR